jgi:hypothetical protein
LAGVGYGGGGVLHGSGVTTAGPLPTSHQRLNTVSIGYTLLGQARLGAVDWRKPPQDE